MTKKDLRRILSYKNPEVVAKFSKNYGIPTKMSEVIFQDTLRFLYITQRVAILREAGKPVPNVRMYEPIKIIDMMWHTFVLYTAEYAEFSFKYFGHFMHHVPSRALGGPREKRVKLNSKRGKEYMEDRYEAFEKYIQFVIEELGEDVATRWFGVFPKKFPMQQILERQLKHG